MAEGISARLGGRLKAALLNLALLAVSLVVALLIAEGMVRLFYPVADGRSNVMLDGTPVPGWFPPGTAYRQVSNEYDALTTITAKAHRVPGADNPDVIFVGDSFTYGYGLADDETFASIFCKERVVACANLGIPGSGTARQVARLAEFIDQWHWRPKEVKFFFFGMSGSFSAGNDFVDNYDYGRQQGTGAPVAGFDGETSSRSTPGAGSTPAAVPERAASTRREPASRANMTLAQRVIGWQTNLLAHSHLLRRVKFHWGPLLKSLLINRPADHQMSDALRYTKEGLQALDELSRRAGFDYTIYLIVPVQDIIRGTYDETLATLNQVSPKPVVPTASLFVDGPQQFYFAYDGHINPTGSRRIAELLIDEAARMARQ